jgi:hypothetical protein
MKTAAARLIHRMRFRFASLAFNTSTKTHTVATMQATPKNTWVINIISFMADYGFRCLKRYLFSLPGQAVRRQWQDRVWQMTLSVMRVSQSSLPSGGFLPV